MALIQLLTILGVGAAIAVTARNSNRDKRLESAFYQILRQHDSCVSLIQLAATAEVSTDAAKVFLDRQIRLLDGIPEVNDEGYTAYRFPAIKTPPQRIVDDW
jgi:hypothetical protein